MCGSYTAPTVTPSKSNAPNRHQVRAAIRKVARTMRKAQSTIGQYSVKLDVMKVLNASAMTSTDYDKTWKRVGSTIEASTFFTRTPGVCGDTDLKVRKAAVL